MLPFTIPAWLTADLPGSGGHLSDQPADFLVDEILAYEASGKGEHLYLHFEKLGLTTLEAVHRLAERLGLRARTAGYAGLKDRNARARQWVSFPWPIKRELPKATDLSDPEGVDQHLIVRAVTRHENKIRRGHAKKNRFSIHIRGVEAGGFERAATILESLRHKGVPNSFGPQRFGMDADNAERARRWILGEERPSGPPRIQTLILSSLQSEIFNRVLDRRIREGSLTRALLGDVMKKHDTGGLFDVTDPSTEQPRVDACLISPTGPLPGEKMRTATGPAKELEDSVLGELALPSIALDKLGPGTRRELRYPLEPDTNLIQLEGGYQVDVTLPGGAYATVLLAELMKPSERVVLRTTEEAED
ncbi:MAG: tRNA pseudouridine(13) synthase TruD [Deltaproteobacteria bacterium]|nr:tRNA pseudouridine(13) synthase TruD [Deltaproteobacteria bacterium]